MSSIGVKLPLRRSSLNGFAMNRTLLNTANPEDLIELRKAQAKIEQSLILEVDNVSKESEEKDKDSDV